MDHLETLLQKNPCLAPCGPAIRAAFGLLAGSFRAGGKLLVCGNGGSAADSDHIVGELMKGFMLPRRLPAELQARLRAVDPECGGLLAETLQQGLPAISLAGHPALSTAFANDADADLVFAQQVCGYGKAGDVLLGLSTSGNARNVYCAMVAAKALGLRVVGLTGPAGGKVKSMCDVCIAVSGADTPAVQENHLPVYHTLCMMLETEFFGTNNAKEDAIDGNE